MTRGRHLQLVTAEGKERRDTCHHRTKNLTRLESIAPDAIERLFLRVLRYICASLAHETTRGWEIAHQIAEAELGLGDGPAFVAHIVALLRAVRVERHGGFAFMAADCPTCSRRVSEEEELCLRLLRAARANDPPTLRRNAAALAMSEAAPKIVLAAETLGVRLDAYALAAELRASPPTGIPSRSNGECR